NVFVRNFVPVHFDLKGQFNNNFGNVPLFFQRLKDVGQLIFSAEGITLYGFIIGLFIVVLIIDVIWIRHLNRQSVIILYGIAAIFVGYAILGYLFPAVVD